VQIPTVKADDLADVPPEGVAMAHQNADHANVLKSGRWQEIVHAYLATVAYTDAMLGRVLDALDRSAHRDNTIVVLWSDHGWSFGEKEHWRKFALWEEPTRAPLIWVVPGLTKPGGVCTRAVDFMSIYPTLLDVTGLPIPAHVEGGSIRPLRSIRMGSACCLLRAGQRGAHPSPFRNLQQADPLEARPPEPAKAEPGGDPGPAFVPGSDRHGLRQRGRVARAGLLKGSGRESLVRREATGGRSNSSLKKGIQAGSPPRFPRPDLSRWPDDFACSFPAPGTTCSTAATSNTTSSPRTARVVPLSG
jgi:hypothetical protein